VRVPLHAWAVHVQRQVPSTQVNTEPVAGACDVEVGGEHVRCMESLLIGLSWPGIVSLFGMRVTQGTIPRLPLSRRTLLASFELPHKPQAKSILTTGARAYTKHAHRSSERWWGEAKGPEAEKNAKARQVVELILNNAVWVNVHELPGDLPIMEVRTLEGYGVRWLADGSQFRGFLEPHAVDGHERQWRH